jgi:hypothetical protein
MSQFFDGPAPTISVKKETPMPMMSRVSPRLNAARLAACSLRSSAYFVLSIAFSSRWVVAGIVFPAQAPSDTGTAPA